MSKTHRVSVPMTPGLERKLRRLSAENGRSLASNFAELAEAGAQNNAVDHELSALRLALENAQPSTEKFAELLAQLRREMLEIVSKHASGEASFGAKKGTAGGIFLPEKAARLLFSEALFSSALAGEILNVELPGAPPKPAMQHLRNARQKSNAALENFLNECAAGEKA